MIISRGGLETGFLGKISDTKPRLTQKPGFLRQSLPPTPETGFLALTFATNEQMS
jgi:hypothetical protein